MKMAYAIVIRLGNHWCHGDDVLRVVVFDGTKIAKLALVSVIIGYNVGCLYVNSFALVLCTNKINLTSLKLPYHHFIAQAYKMIVDDILYHLLNVSLA